MKFQVESHVVEKPGLSEDLVLIRCGAFEVQVKARALPNRRNHGAGYAALTANVWHPQQQKVLNGSHIFRREFY